LLTPNLSDLVDSGGYPLELTRAQVQRYMAELTAAGKEANTVRLRQNWRRDRVFGGRSRHHDGGWRRRPQLESQTGNLGRL
jgi:hypothetical protein